MDDVEAERRVPLVQCGDERNRVDLELLWAGGEEGRILRWVAGVNVCGVQSGFLKLGVKAQDGGGSLSVIVSNEVCKLTSRSYLELVHC